MPDVRYGQPRSIVTDRLQSYRAAMRIIGNAADQECGRWLNNRAENSHQPFRRRERAMAKFRDMKTLVCTENLIRSARLPAMKQVLPAR